MYVILGGAHNGKRAFAGKLAAELPPKELVICEGRLPELQKATADKRYIIAGFERMLLPYLHEPEEVAAEHIFAQIVHIARQADVICICTDTSRGIVPIEKEARLLRDACGRLYQKLCSEAGTVVRIWYGLPQFLKGEHYGQN